MLKPTVITGYSKETDLGLELLAQNVYNALNPNPDFIWDETIMPQFRADIEAYSIMLVKAINGTPADTLAKKEARSRVVNGLKKIASGVNLQADYDLQKLQSSGLRLAKAKAKVGILPKPSGFAVKSGGNQGSLLCRADCHRNALSYLFYSAPVPAPGNIGEWRLTPSATHKKEINGFMPGQQYELKCAYQGSEEKLVFSDSVFIYAQ